MTVMAFEQLHTAALTDPSISIPCDNDRHNDCNGWVTVPFNGVIVAPCHCDCDHPRAWTEEQATDQLLAGRDRAYPGEQVYVGGRPRILGWWPGCTPRPVYMVVAVTMPGREECYELLVTVTEPSDDYETNKALAADIAEAAGHTLVPSMGGARFCAWRR